jgi:nitroreductase
MPILSPFLERRAYRAIDSKPIDEEVLTRLAEAAATAVVTNNDWSLVIGNRVFAPFEAGMATMAYQAQAVSEGLYIHPIAGFNADAVKEALKIPASETLLTLLIIGYPGDDSNLKEHHLKSEHGARVRLPLEKVYAKDRWNDRLLP